jgi:hypothetical protein
MRVDDAQHGNGYIEVSSLRCMQCVVNEKLFRPVSRRRPTLVNDSGDRRPAMRFSDRTS